MLHTARRVTELIREKRHVGAHDGEGLLRTISTGMVGTLTHSFLTLFWAEPQPTLNLHGIPVHIARKTDPVNSMRNAVGSSFLLYLTPLAAGRTQKHNAIHRDRNIHDV